MGGKLRISCKTHYQSIGQSSLTVVIWVELCRCGVKQQSINYFYNPNKPYVCTFITCHY